MSFLYSIGLIVASFLGIGIAIAIQRMRIWSLEKQRNRQIVREVNSKYDHRRPILYLRPFVADGTPIIEEKPDIYTKAPFQKEYIPTIPYYTINIEEKFAREIDKIGPFVAIGDAAQKSIDQFGAVRVYHTDETWREAIKALMNEASVIFVRLTYPVRNNFMWEIGQLNERYIHKTIFFVDVNDEGQYLSVKDFFQAYNLSFPVYNALYDGRLVTFNNERKYKVNYAISATPIYKQIRKSARSFNQDDSSLKNAIERLFKKAN